MLKKYEWYYCDAVKGVEDGEEEAIEKLFLHLQWNRKDGFEESLDGETLYFWEAEAEAKDDDGAYTPHIREVRSC